MAELLTSPSTRPVPTIDPADLARLSGWSGGRVEPITDNVEWSATARFPVTATHIGAKSEPELRMTLVYWVKSKRSITEDQASRPLFEEAEIEQWLRQCSQFVEQYRPLPVTVRRERSISLIDPYAELLSQFEP